VCYEFVLFATFLCVTFAYVDQTARKEIIIQFISSIYRLVPPMAFERPFTNTTRRIAHDTHAMNLDSTVELQTKWKTPRVYQNTK
jgi:hypothetical protein